MMTEDRKFPEGDDSSFVTKHHCLLKINRTVISWPLLAAQVVMHTWCADGRFISTHVEQPRTQAHFLLPARRKEPGYEATCGAASYPGSFPLTGTRGRAWVQGYMWSS